MVLRNLTIYSIVTSLYRARLAKGVLLVSALILVKLALGLRSSNKAIRIPIVTALSHVTYQILPYSTDLRLARPKLAP